MTSEQARTLKTQFDNHTLPKTQWTHRAHCIVALCYCIDFPLPLAVQKIRNGIRTYNVSAGGENTDHAGYHETITLFYISQIAHYLITTGVHTLTDETLAGFLQQSFLAKEYLHQFYSHEQLKSKEARRSWLPPRLTEFIS